MIDSGPAEAVPAGPERTSLGKNLMALLASQLVTWVLSASIIVVQPRLLGPAAEGQLRIAGSIWAIVGMLATCGTTTLLIIHIARHPEQARPLERSALRVRTFLFLMMAPLIAGFAWLAGYSARVDIVIAIFGAAALVGLAAGTCRSAVVGLERMTVIARIDVINEVLIIVLVLGALAIGGRVIAVAAISLFCAGVSSVLYRRAFAKIEAGPQAPKALFAGRALMRAGLPYLLSDAMVIIYVQVDTVVISLVASEREIGWYAAADGIYGSLLFVPSILVTALFPAIARLHEHTPDQVDGVLRQAFRTLLLLGVWIGIGAVVISGSFTRLVFGPKFVEAGPVLAVFGVVAILTFQTILLSQFAVATGRIRVWTTLLIVAIVASIPLDIWLVPRTRDRYGNGAIGGALSYIITETLQLAVGIALIAPHLFTKETIRRVVHVVIAGATMLGIGWQLRDLFFVIPGTAATLGYFAVIAVLDTLDGFERKRLAVGLQSVKAKLASRRSVGA